MTSQVIHSMPTVSRRLPGTSTPAVSSGDARAQMPVSTAGAATWRRTGTVQAFVGLCWAVGITASFLTVGLVGMLAADVPPYALKTLEDMVAETAMVETSMAELQAQEAAAEETAEEPTELPVEMTQVLETPPEAQDLPELVEAMTLEDVFAVPSAPKIEDALRPVDPVAKPRQTPTPPRPRTATAPRSGTGSPNATPGAVGGTAGGSGTGTGKGKGRYPKPPYPSFARSAGMQGTVRLTIRFGASGSVESVKVVSSTGYSALDSSTEAFVRRNWHGNAFESVNVPITFKQR